MSTPLPTPLLVLDFEATCARDGSILAADIEIIEVGAVWADAQGEILDQFQAFVRPQVHPLLSPFCKELTGISQDDVDGADGLVAVMGEFHRFCSIHDTQTWLSWGDWDAKQMRIDCRRAGCPNPLDGWTHINGKPLFAKVHQLAQQPGLARALKLAGIQGQGRAHRGIDDAINTAALLPFMQGQPLPSETPLDSPQKSQSPPVR